MCRMSEQLLYIARQSKKLFRQQQQSFWPKYGIYCKGYGVVNFSIRLNRVDWDAFMDRLEHGLKHVQ